MWLVIAVVVVIAIGIDDLRLWLRNRIRLSSRPSSALTYRSRDGSSLFHFQFTDVDGDIRVHILGLPNPRIGSCHVLEDGHGPYICWSSPIRSMTTARAVAALWAEATLAYQRSGHVF